MIFYRLDLSNNDFSRIPTNILSNAAAANLVELDLSGNSIPAISIADFVQRFRVSCWNYSRADSKFIYCGIFVLTNSLKVVMRLLTARRMFFNLLNCTKQWVMLFEKLCILYWFLLPCIMSFFELTFATSGT